MTSEKKQHGGAGRNQGRKATGKSKRVSVSVTPDLREVGLTKPADIKKAALLWAAHLKKEAGMDQIDAARKLSTEDQTERHNRWFRVDDYYVAHALLWKKMSWEDAKSYCESLGGFLPDTGQLNGLLHDPSTLAEIEALGLTDEWVWSSEEDGNAALAQIPRDDSSQSAVFKYHDEGIVVPCRKDKIQVMLRRNNGDEKFHDVDILEDALKVAKKFRTTENYMVCIYINGDRTHRWDRPPIVGNNRWKRAKGLDIEFGVPFTGPLREIHEIDCSAAVEKSS